METQTAAWMRDALAEHRSAGEYVLQSARMVGDEDDHAIWRRSRASWRDEVAATMNRAFPGGDRRADALIVQMSTQPAGWKQVYEAEIRAVQAGLALVAALAAEASEQLAAQPPASSPEPAAVAAVHEPAAEHRVQSIPAGQPARRLVHAPAGVPATVLGNAWSRIKGGSPAATLRIFGGA